MLEGQTSQEAEGGVETKRAQIPVRTTPTTRARLTEAAKAAGRSLTQEIEQRLERSFETEDREGGPATHNLLNLFASEIGLIERYTGAPWASDVTTWSAVRSRLRTKLDEVRPPFENAEQIASIHDEMETLKVRIEAFAEYLLKIGAIRRRTSQQSVLAEVLQGLTNPVPLPYPSNVSLQGAGMFGSRANAGILSRLATSALDLAHTTAKPHDPIDPDCASLMLALAHIDYELAIDWSDRSSWSLHDLKGAPINPSEYDGIVAAFTLLRKFCEERLEKSGEFLAAFKDDDAAIKAGERIAQQIDAAGLAMKAREGQA